MAVWAARVGHFLLFAEGQSRVWIHAHRVSEDTQVLASASHARGSRQAQVPAPAAGAVGGPNLRRNPRVEPILEPWHHPALDEGIAWFNAGKHWHAHEAWEPLWMGLEGDDKLFVQGLIMAAAMLHQYRRGVVQGVVHHFENARVRLEPHLPEKWGVDVAGLLRQLVVYAESVEAGATDMRLDPGTVRIHRTKGPDRPLRSQGPTP